MIRAVLLDAGPLSLAANPRLSPTTRACRNWLDLLRQFGISILIPEIADYEVRRELIRARKRKALLRLDELAIELVYLPITTTAMRRAAELWAQARHVGQPTAADDTIDADMILVAQAEATGISNLVIATSNVDHIGRFFPAELWSNIAAAPPTP